MQEGTSLLEALTAVCVEAGARWVRAHGTVRACTLAVDTPDGPLPVADWSGPATLVSLDGSWDGEELTCTAVVSFVAGGVPVMVAGRLLRAEIVRVEHDQRLAGPGHGSATPSPTVRAAVEPASPPRAETTGRSAPAPPAPASAGSSAPAARAAAPAPRAPSPAARPAAPSAWAAVAQSSEQMKLREWASQDEGEDPVDPEDLRRNDVLVHPHLGDCVVQSRLDVHSVQVRIPGGRVRKLMLSIFDIVPDGVGRRFRLVPRST